MKFLFYTLALIFVLVALMLLLLSSTLIAKLICKPKLEDLDLEREKKIKANLMVLSSNAEPEEKADAIEQLIQNKYITIHTLKNKGNGFSDKQQTRIYANALTKEKIKVLFEVEACDGGYSFRI